MVAPVDVTGEVDAGTGGDLAEEGELGDLAVLELDVAEANEGLLIVPVKEAEGVVELEGDLGAELALYLRPRRSWQTGGLGPGQRQRRRRRGWRGGRTSSW